MRSPNVCFCLFKKVRKENNYTQETFFFSGRRTNMTKMTVSLRSQADSYKCIFHFLRFFFLIFFPSFVFQFFVEKQTKALKTT